MTKAQQELLRDLWLTYEIQIEAMKKAQTEGKMVTAALHNRMAQQLLETYFDAIDKTLT